MKQMNITPITVQGPSAPAPAGVVEAAVARLAQLGGAIVARCPAPDCAVCAASLDLAA